MTIVKLDHCVIHISDWDRSNAFYRDVLGAELIAVLGARSAPKDTGQPAEGLRRDIKGQSPLAGSGWSYRFGDAQLNVHGPGTQPSPLARLPVQPGGSDVCFEWPGPIEEAEAHLSGHDVPVELGPVARFGAGGQGLSVYFRDPDGSLLEFISYQPR